ADGGGNVVLRVDDLLPRVDEVRSGDRVRLVADPVPVRVLAGPELEDLLRGDDLRPHVVVVVALSVDDVGAAPDRRAADDGGGEAEWRGRWGGRRRSRPSRVC